MVRPSTNPFTPDQPVSEEERFFGREELMEWIADHFVGGRRFLLIYGVPRVGKTSLLLRLRPKLAGRFFSAYADLEAAPQGPARDMLWHLVSQVHEHLWQDSDTPGTLSRDAFLSQHGYLQQEVFPLWRRNLHGRHLVLLVDGPGLARFEEATWAELVLRLREIIAQELDLCLVLAVRGTSAQAAEPVPALRGLPYRDLDFLTETQAEELLVGGARYQLGFDYDALRRIHVLSGGHPYLVQLYGFELYRHLAPFGQVTVHVVNDLMPTVTKLADGFFAQEWSALSRDAQAALATLGAMQGYRGTMDPWDIVVVLRRAGIERSAEALERTLRELCNRGVMRWLGGSTYVLRLELWRPWLAGARPLAEVLHGKRLQRKRSEAPRRKPGIDWSTILPWIGIGLAVFLVVRVWNSRQMRSPVAISRPTLPPGTATPRPTATRVVLPGRIAFQSQADPEVPWCIWSMRDNGTDPAPMTDGSTQDTMPAWSPDGRRLAFISDRAGNRDVWVMNADGSRLENITNTVADEWTPAWSPDGLEIAFASYREGNWELYIAKPDGSDIRPLTRHPALDFSPSWSRDGGQLAFVSERDGNTEVYVINRDGTGLRRLTQNQVTDLSPQWSPDGTLIAFESYRDGNMEIYTMAPDGSAPRNLTNEPNSDEHGPSWSPDGQRIAYYSNRDGTWDIFVMLADGSQKANLTQSPASEQAPAWQPRTP